MSEIPAAAPVTISVGRVSRWLAGSAAILVALGLLILYPKFILGHDYVYGFVPRFDLNGEINAPTWFSSAILFVASLLLAYIAAACHAGNDPFSRHWTILAAIFLLMSIDETAGFHGMLSAPLRRALGFAGAFYHAWVVPVGIGVVIVAVAYWRFVWSLPPETRRRFLLSGIVYVVGALGGELAGGAFRTGAGALGDQPPDDILYGLLTVVEEALEMTGIIIFIYALLDFIARRWHGLRIDLARADRTEARQAQPRRQA